MGKKLYFDTNQLYYLRKIADESQGNEFGDYSWAYEYFYNNTDMIKDIRALCYIGALQDQWDLEFSPSDASYKELFKNISTRAKETRETWKLFLNYQIEQGIVQKENVIKQTNSLEMGNMFDILSFVEDQTDREILRDFYFSKADYLLTSDDDILRHKEKLEEIGIKVIRPHDWINDFTKSTRGDEDAVDFIERILFTFGSAKEK